MQQYFIKTFYAFHPLEESRLPDYCQTLVQKAAEKNVIGLVILGKEGFNTTLASTNELLFNEFIEDLKKILQIQETSLIKTSVSEKRPFRRFDVKIREEIVTFEREEFVPKGEHRHLSPQKWNEFLHREDVVVIDTRNTYETRIGKFKKAIDLEIEEFVEFSEKIKNLDTDREKPHLIYCTGGIRCEKAIYEMEAQGFKNVFQLEGGILNYLEKCPDDSFEGECFVFDSRVAVDQKLQPSKHYSLCPHCGDVSNIDLSCLKCDHEFKICEKCLEKSKTQKEYHTCSKNCRHHYKLRPNTKGPHQKQYYSE
jgi:UPF0176 protein